LPPSVRPKVLIMINQGARPPGFDDQIGVKTGASSLLTPSPGLGHGGTMNGFLAICSICREIIS
jgi:hypothetical protein